MNIDKPIISLLKEVQCSGVYYGASDGDGKERMDAAYLACQSAILEIESERDRLSSKANYYYRLFSRERSRLEGLISNLGD